MIDRIYFRASIYAAGRGLIGWAKADGTTTRRETDGAHQHWTDAQDAAELYCKGCDNTISYAIERVTIEVERMMEGPE
jgi:hypothetical protein